MAIEDWRVWATRPSAANRDWAARLRQEGYNCLELPLLDIKPLTDPASEQAIKNLVLDLDQFNKVIFVSQNAVHFGFEWIYNYWPQLPKGIDYFGVGEKTARAIADQGAQVSSPGMGMNTETLLALPELQDVWGQKILICRGRGGLPKLGESLHQRGAMVRYLELYERLLPVSALDQSRTQVPNLTGRDLLVAFSGETLHNLLAVLTDAGLSAWQNPLLVPGSRVQELAEALGFCRVICAANASESTMLASLTEFCTAHSPPT